MKTRWDHYKSLELLPEDVPEPPTANRWMPGVRLLRRSLADTLVRSLSVEYRLQHFERCLAMQIPQQTTETRINEFMLTESHPLRIQALIQDADEQEVISPQQIESWRWYT